MVIENYIFGRYFLEKEQTKLVTSRKTADSTLFANDKHFSFQVKIRLLQNLYPTP